jgi:hypothetical protein
MNQAKSALASTPFLFIYISTQHSRVRRGREIMKVIIFRETDEFHTHQKTSPQVNPKLKKEKKETNL